jgi:hypothetical protein
VSSAKGALQSVKETLGAATGSGDAPRLVLIGPPGAGK